MSRTALAAASILLALLPLSPPAAAVPHAPLWIEGDAALLAAAAAEGWPGDGSAASPIVIGGYTISAAGATGVFLGNVTLRVVLEALVIHDGGGTTNLDVGGRAALWLLNVASPIVRGNTLTTSEAGLRLTRTTDALVEDNVFTGNRYGAVCQGAARSTFRNNVATGNVVGFYLTYAPAAPFPSCQDATFEANVASDNRRPEPARYTGDYSGFALYSADRIRFAGNEATGNNYGANVVFGRDVTFRENLLRNDRAAVYAANSPRLRIENNTCEQPAGYPYLFFCFDLYRAPGVVVANNTGPAVGWLAWFNFVDDGVFRNNRGGGLGGWQGSGNLWENNDAVDLSVSEVTSSVARGNRAQRAYATGAPGGELRLEANVITAPWGAALVMGGPNVVAEANTIRTPGTGIALYDASVARGNTIEGAQIGIDVDSASLDALVADNVIDRAATGLALRGTATTASGNIIRNATVAIDVDGAFNSVTSGLATLSQIGVRLNGTANALTGGAARGNAVGVEVLTALSSFAGATVEGNAVGVRLAAPIELSGVSVSGNDVGVSIEADGAALVDSTLRGNGDGVRVLADGVRVRNVDASANSGHGIVLLGDRIGVGTSVTGNGGCGIVASGRDALILESVATDNALAGFCILGGAATDLRDSAARGGRYGYLLVGADGATLHNARATYTQTGFHLEGSMSVWIANASASVVTDGITIVGGGSHDIDTPTLRPRGAGIRVTDGLAVQIRGGRVLGGERGVDLDGASGATVRGMALTVSGAGEAIVLRNGANGNAITRNELIGARVGLHAYEAVDNVVYDNRFASTRNAIEEACCNAWNVEKTPGANIVGGPYLGGNWWDDYVGVDTDADGLGDVPYTPLASGPGGCGPGVGVREPVACGPGDTRPLLRFAVEPTVVTWPGGGPPATLP